ncbi:hypothetical protein SRHO_G00048600 [Serrasalmus rhombeus]
MSKEMGRAKLKSAENLIYKAAEIILPGFFSSIEPSATCELRILINLKMNGNKHVQPMVKEVNGHLEDDVSKKARGCGENQDSTKKYSPQASSTYSGMLDKEIPKRTIQKKKIPVITILNKKIPKPTILEKKIQKKTTSNP